MGTVHNLILLHGIDRARSMAETKAERRAIHAAAAVMSEERSGLGITHAGFAMTSLPHKRIDDAVWERQGYQTTLLIESGRTRQKTLIGIPYGSVARLILLYLQTEAIRTGSPKIVLGRSLNRWIERLDLTPGGKTRQLVTEQARRISACFNRAWKTGPPRKWRAVIFDLTILAAADTRYDAFDLPSPAGLSGLEQLSEAWRSTSAALIRCCNSAWS